MSALPKIDPDKRGKKIILEGEVANPANPPSGCYFHPRSRYAKDICSIETPEIREISAGHYVSCHFAEELTLTKYE